jgi:glyoxylase I family protein
MRPVPKTAFAHVGLNCRDMRATERFYVRHFGFRRARVVPLGKGNRIVFLKSKTAYLELFQAKGRARTVARDGPPEAGFRHMAFQVASVDRKIREMGKAAKVTLGPFSFDGFIKGWRGAWLMDPDGRIIELSQGYRDEKR